MNALFSASELCRCDPRRSIDALAAFRQVEAEAEAAAAAVRAACERYRADRTPEADAAYRDADRAYDRARLRFQLVSRETVTAIKAIARFARELQLANGQKERLL